MTMPPDKLTHASNTVSDARSAPHSPRRARVPVDSSADRDLTPTLKIALIALRPAGASAEAHCWRTSTGERIENKTIYALYDRYLVKMVLDQRRRQRATAVLTDIGEHAARGVENAEADNFEKATLVYGDGEV